MQAVTSPESAAYEITQQLSCEKPSCRCHLTARKGFGLTHCPVHIDNKPSLNVSIKNGVLLVHCQATCSQETVITSLTERGLWVKDSPREFPKQEIVATYDYRDPHGKLLFQSVRFVPKNFSQRRPNDTDPGKWIWNLDGIQRVLYKLPELLAADPKRLRFIVEGEKDVETLQRHGFVATCNVGGAGKWKPEYSDWFHDRDVVLPPDNDDAGRKHMVSVAENLQDVTHSIRWLELPGLAPKGDITEWFDTGGTPDALKQLVRAAKFFAPDVVQERIANPLSDISLERSVMAWCFELPATISYLKLDDFTDTDLRQTLDILSTHQYVDVRPLWVPEADPSLDVHEAIRKLRDLSYRRASIRIAECITRVAGDVTTPFDPCIAADVLRTVCEQTQSCAGITQRLSECLDLS